MLSVSSRGAVRIGAVAAAAWTLGGCSTVVLNPAGDVAHQEADLLLWATGLMLLIILPVMALTVIFAWRYRETNQDAPYAPDWDHSTGLELVIWATPLMIIIALGALTWVGSHTLDPYRPLDRTGPGRAVAANARPLEIEVVSLDWKWLFIYPEQGIATVNRLVLPVDRPVHFRMTSSSVMNTFWVPSMAGMVYTMPGMETTLHAVLNRPGSFAGLSGNYSGAGFSGMNFRTFSVPTGEFDKWVAGVRGKGAKLDAASYLKLEMPSQDVAPFAFGGIDPGLYPRIVAMCVHPGMPCMGSGPAAHVNDRPMLPGEKKGALTRQPQDKGTAPHNAVPGGHPPGTTEPGSDANRNMTLLDPRDAPGMPGAERA
jgi:cytochrome o ubiquinol oxidase subunit II